MNSASTAENSSLGAVWLERVRTAESGPELLEFLVKRLSRPHEEGPRLDDRHGEGPEEAFEQLAKADEEFRARLDRTIADYFGSPAASPVDEATRPVLRGMLELVQRRALSGAFAPVRAWIKRHETELRADAGAYLARAALGALATAQPQGLVDGREFWLGWWRNGPPPWQPRAFVGLRRQDPDAAAEEIPLLLRRAREQHQDPGALLHGMWSQPGGREAILTWLQRNDTRPESDEVRKALRPRVAEADLDKLNRPAPARVRRPLMSLAPSQPRDWF